MKAKILFPGQSSIRLVPRVEDMNHHLCAQCREQAVKDDVLDVVAALAEKGSWLCPFEVEECGRSIAA